jgi:putative Ca2+/H+ antiporter (TMEM165/GDT1 family)
MNSTVFLTTFGLIFLAELGDKTQLTAMTLATHYSWKRTFWGIATAFALLNIGAVLAGTVLSGLFHQHMFWIKLVSALLFLFFGIASLRSKGYDPQEEEAEERRFKSRGPVVTSFCMIFLAELGDKTQLVTASLAAQHNSPFAVFAGSTLALWSVSLIGIFLGRQLTRFIPLSYIHRAAGALFLLFAAVILYQLFFIH